jgi:hypothetical protein
VELAAEIGSDNVTALWWPLSDSEHARAAGRRGS